MDRDPVIVIGAGVAGLSCAIRLAEGGCPPVVVDAADAVGGRIRTDRMETDEGAYLLDRGFQVYLTAYPEGRRLLDLGGLELRRFLPAALVRRRGRFSLVGDPFRMPTALVRTLLSRVFGLGDLLPMLRLHRSMMRGDDDGDVTLAGRTAIEIIESSGVSGTVIDAFLRPFFGGVFLDRELTTSARTFRFVFRMFARGHAALPAGGMQRIPEQMASRLPEGSIHLGRRVASVEPPSEGAPARVRLEGGETMEAGLAVIATDGATAATLVDGLPGTAWQRTVTIYYAAPEPPIDGPLLVLDGEGRGPANHVAVPSNVAPGYAPPGRALVCANLVGWSDAPDEELDSQVREQLHGWFGPAVDGWRNLRTYRIDRAVPRQRPGDLPPSQPLDAAPGLYVCGDFREDGSINGALRSGRRVAEAILQSTR